MEFSLMSLYQCKFCTQMKLTCDFINRRGNLLQINKLRMHNIIVCKLSMFIFLNLYRCNVHKNKCYKIIMLWKPKRFIYTFFSNIISGKLNV